MDQLPKLVFVETEGVGRIEAAYATTAQPTAALLVQWERAAERSAALYAEVFSRQWLRLRQTGPTNRDSGNFMQGLIADAALVWKN